MATSTVKRTNGSALRRVSSGNLDAFMVHPDGAVDFERLGTRLSKVDAEWEIAIAALRKGLTVAHCCDPESAVSLICECAQRVPFKLSFRYDESEADEILWITAS